MTPFCEGLREVGEAPRWDSVHDTLQTQSPGCQPETLFCLGSVRFICSLIFSNGGKLCNAGHSTVLSEVQSTFNYRPPASGPGLFVQEWLSNSLTPAGFLQFAPLKRLWTPLVFCCRRWTAEGDTDEEEDRKSLLAWLLVTCRVVLGHPVWLLFLFSFNTLPSHIQHLLVPGTETFFLLFLMHLHYTLKAFWGLTG